MTQPAIHVEGLWKEYVIGRNSVHGATFREAIVEGIKVPLRRLTRGGPNSRSEQRFWALKDVSLTVQPGEVVGVIGRNGAGKSTLLKILSRITAPTVGRIEIRGRIASLLEVGTGFHPELTGRENIRLNGAILGMSSTEIGSKFDEIVDFSGVEKFIDTPVKHYSSGMQMRLAFAVAAHLEPEILFVDEVLAVGDAEFQKKCLGKMRAIAEREGRTVLFVSHNLSAVSSLCSSGVLLSSGLLQFRGEVSEVLAQYLQTSGAFGEFLRTWPAASEASLMAASAVCAFDQAKNQTLLTIRLEVLMGKTQSISIGIRVKDALGTPVGYIPIGAFKRSDTLYLLSGTHTVEISVPVSNWATGTYYFSVDLAVPDVQYLDRVEDFITIDIDAVGQGQTKSLAQSWGWGSLLLNPSEVKVVSEKEL